MKPKLEPPPPVPGQPKPPIQCAPVPFVTAPLPRTLPAAHAMIEELRAYIKERWEK
jgi:hypothetical protein